MALHLGQLTRCKMIATDGVLTIEQHGICCPIDHLSMKRADRGVTVTDPSGQMHLDLVEHLFSALGGLGIRSGIRIQTEDRELPLLDGGSLQWAKALRKLRIPSSAPTMRIVGTGTITVGASTYELMEADSYDYGVSIDIKHAQILETTSQWNGSASDFIDRIASARTFGFMNEAAALRETSRARGANLKDVVVLCDDGSSISDPKPMPDECVRHKLLDLIGDWNLWAGLPLGKIRAHRPGHQANYEAARRSISEGLVQRVGTR